MQTETRKFDSTQARTTFKKSSTKRLNRTEVIDDPFATRNFDYAEFAPPPGKAFGYLYKTDKE
jgi:hypothetical protein